MIRSFRGFGATNIKRITNNKYDTYSQSNRDKIAELDARLAVLQEAEDNYYITATYLLELANRAYDLFKSSEVEERRQLLKLVLQNLRVEGKEVRYDLIKPFDTILVYADSKSWLRIVKDVRTTIQQQEEYVYIPDLRVYANK